MSNARSWIKEAPCGSVPYPCALADRSLALSLYTQKEMAERHRHRYEFNNAYRELFASKGMVFSGLSPDGALVEAIELRDHPWFIGVQFHPEFTSRPFECHPLVQRLYPGWDTATPCLSPGTAPPG